MEGVQFSEASPVSDQHSRADDKVKQDKLLDITIYVGAVIIFVFGGCMHLLNYFGWNLQHSESWELGALLWTALFVVYYFFTLKLVGKNKPDKTIMVFLLAIVGLTVVAWVSLLRWRHQIVRVLSVTGIGLFLMLTDRLLSKYQTNKTDRRAFRQSYLLAGVPMVIAYVVLNVYLVSDILLHRVFLHNDIEDPEVFFSGAISFQLLASNVIFVIIQKGMIKNVGKKPKKQKQQPKPKPSER